MLLLLLVLMPFDEDTMKLTNRLKPLISRIPMEKYENVCRVYELLLRLKDNRKKRKKLLLNMNMCSHLTRWVDSFYRGDQENWHLQLPLWGEYVDAYK